MQSSLNSIVDPSHAKVYTKAYTTPASRIDPLLAEALTKFSAEAQKKTRAKAQDFEAMFLNSMFSQMTSGVKGDGPFGDTTGTGMWRSMLTDEYSKSFAKSGGVGISNDVFRTLILQQANRAG
jgi:peptidoglycan hydrolase FlgJ